MENKKYELTDETIQCNGRTLYRIKALKDFSNVHKGDLGGFIRKESNLSQDRDCWVYDDAKVFGNAKVSDNVIIYNNAQVFGNARVYGNAVVCSTAKVYDNAKVYEKARICGNAKVYDNAQVSTNALVANDAQVYGNSYVLGNAKIVGHAKVFGNAAVYDHAWVNDNAKVYDGAIVKSDAEICGNAEVKSIDDYAVFKNFWSSGRYFTWTKSNNMWKVGCFYGTGKELVKKAYLDSKESGRKYKATVNYIKSIFL